MPKKQSLIRKFQTCALAAPDIPWKKDWDTDEQPERHSIAEYHEIARTLRIEALKSAQELLRLAPFAKLKDDQGNQYTLSEIAPLIAHLEEHPEDERFLKQENSAQRKLLDSTVNQHQERVLDYLRFQILINTPQEAATLRNALLCGNPPTGITVTSYKDQFRRPCEEGGHAALKTHILVDNGSQKILAEMQISIKDMEEAKLPKALRDTERAMRDASSHLHEAGINRHFLIASACEEIHDRVRALRRFANLTILKKKGFLCMCDPDYNAENVMQEAIGQYNNGSSRANAMMAHFELPRDRKDLERALVH